MLFTKWCARHRNEEINRDYNNIQIQPGLKAKLWLIIRVNQKKLNLVMLNGDDNENGFKTNRSNQQSARAAHFFF